MVSLVSVMRGRARDTLLEWIEGFSPEAMASVCLQRAMMAWRVSAKMSGWSQHGAWPLSSITWCGHPNLVCADSAIPPFITLSSRP